MDLRSRIDLLIERHQAHMSEQWKPFARSRESSFFTESSVWDSYAYSFRLAAETIANECLENQSKFTYLKLPMFYLYRHSVELELKSLWKSFHEKGWLDKKIELTHNIVRLWQSTKEPLKERQIISVQDDFLKNIEKSFDLYNNIDISSTSGRYPTIDSQSSYEIDFSLEEFIISMDDINTFFYGLAGMIEQYDTYMSEMYQLSP